MLYEEIRRGCKKYHNSTFAYDEAYVGYMCIQKDKPKWDQPETIDLAEAGNLVNFLNKWKTRTPMKPYHLLPALQETVPTLNLLGGKTIPNVDFGEIVNNVTTERLIADCFDTLADCGPRYESVGTSKMLHTINPELFVMWDTAIKKGYRPGGNGMGKGWGYAHYFLPMMQRLAKKAIDEVMETENLSLDDTINSLAPDAHTLAKVLDEYNYAKFTAT